MQKDIISNSSIKNDRFGFYHVKWEQNQKKLNYYYYQINCGIKL
jgi:hypothetical protein